jgi:hypothetical protein
MLPGDAMRCGACGGPETGVVSAMVSFRALILRSARSCFATSDCALRSMMVSALMSVRMLIRQKSCSGSAGYLQLAPCEARSPDDSRSV